ncbi:DNA polymerase III subunit chi [Sulfuricystis multivorans]|uniref:DNA polymerase III subunit chi n=1 Tax=Sulfuricystis multivorans TaxID=2211108 RepID=UPI000F83511E|nr:DNA polymerase III subunit chi [Sulfuricystis multivorans]
MTRIFFLHGAADRIQAAALWLQRAWLERVLRPAKGPAMLVYAPAEEDAERLDRLLWTQPALSFVPHCRADSPLAGETPILITGRLDEPPVDTCLVNLSNELPATFSRFEYLVEVVSTSDADRVPARSRFKFYRDRGYALENHDISGGVQCAPMMI